MLYHDRHSQYRASSTTTIQMLGTAIADVSTRPAYYHTRSTVPYLIVGVRALLGTSTWYAVW
eukprot:3613360-Rhodomonas_salina.9